MSRYNISLEDIELLKKINFSPVFSKIKYPESGVIEIDDDLMDEFELDMTNYICLYGLTEDQNDATELGHQLEGILDDMYEQDMAR